MMDINGYLGGRERHLTNQRQCWLMTSFRQPMRAVDEENVMTERRYLKYRELLVIKSPFCEVRPGRTTEKSEVVLIRARTWSCRRIRRATQFHQRLKIVRPCNDFRPCEGSSLGDNCGLTKVNDDDEILASACGSTTRSTSFMKLVQLLACWNVR